MKSICWQQYDPPVIFLYEIKSKLCILTVSPTRLCSSYPQKLLVPIWITDKELESVASFRSWKRIPVVVYRYFSLTPHNHYFHGSVFMFTDLKIWLQGTRRTGLWSLGAASLRSAGGAGGTRTMSTWWLLLQRPVRWVPRGPVEQRPAGNVEKHQTPATAILVKRIIGSDWCW